MDAWATSDASKSVCDFLLGCRTEHGGLGLEGSQSTSVLSVAIKQTNGTPFWVEKSGSDFGCYLSDSEFWTSKMSIVRWLSYGLNDTHSDGPMNGNDALCSNMFTFDSFNLINIYWVMKKKSGFNAIFCWMWAAKICERLVTNLFG